MPFKIIRQDITKVPADAIVNTANPRPVFGRGTDSAIFHAAGERKLLKERRKIGHLMPGEVAVTAAFDLPAKYIIHTVGPVWKGGDYGEFETLAACYRKSLLLAKQLGCKSIAFPLISAGNYGFPKEKALAIALDEIYKFLNGEERSVSENAAGRKDGRKDAAENETARNGAAENESEPDILDNVSPSPEEEMEFDDENAEDEMEVTLVVFDRKEYQLSASLMADVQQYIDDKTVEMLRGEEYHAELRRREDISDDASAKIPYSRPSIRPETSAPVMERPRPAFPSANASRPQNAPSAPRPERQESAPPIADKKRPRKDSSSPMSAHRWSFPGEGPEGFAMGSASPKAAKKGLFGPRKDKKRPKWTYKEKEEQSFGFDEGVFSDALDSEGPGALEEAAFDAAFDETASDAVFEEAASDAAFEEAAFDAAFDEVEEKSAEYGKASDDGSFGAVEEEYAPYGQIYGGGAYDTSEEEHVPYGSAAKQAAVDESSKKEATYRRPAAEKERPEAGPLLSVKSSQKPQKSLEDVIRHVGENFQQMLFRLIDERGLSDAQVYKKANVDRKLFSKIRCNPDYTPKKGTALALAIALRLNLDETVDLIGRAGIALSPGNVFDIIVEYCIEKEIYDIYQINAILFEYGQPTLGC